MKPEQNMKPGSTVRISNALNRAAHRLTVSEKRLLMLAVSEINKHGGNPAIELKAVELAEMFNLDSKNTYRELKKVCKSIMRKPPISVKMDGFIREINWAGACDYYDHEGRVIIQFTPQIAPHISALQSHFTQYKLSRATGFLSSYSWKLFELIMQFKKTGLLRISLDEFKVAMEVPKAYCNDFGALRRRVIDSAIKEIREKDGLDIQYTTTKRGRTVTGLTFTFPPEQQTALPLPTAPAGQRSRSPASTKPDPNKAEQEARRQALAELTGIKSLAERAGVEADTLITKQQRVEFKKFGLI